MEVTAAGVPFPGSPRLIGAGADPPPWRRHERRARRPVALLALVVGLALAAGASHAQGGAGSVAGTVRLAGEPPSIPPTILGATHHCVEVSGRKLPQLEVVVGEERGLANVFVRLEGDGLKAAAAPPDEPLVVEQRGCLYHPRMSAGRAGQTLRVINKDNFLHNVISVSELGTDFNIGQPFADMEFDFELTAEQMILHLHCNFHPWMHAYVGVADHPWFTVTAEDGRFELAGVPPGAYDLVLWHERLGTLRAAVSVEPGVAANVELEYGTEAGAGP